eukprot:CAMPEP_0182443714 /NCGR_PEP_ID=MMETSP1172-20130603/2370_1 /TAXON_ID=708627 /ORGANISM="Timspurckia oligopyrenoides, Strain CCMP3278" /LENGTH=498 /DNA_ID=CAMNT_0024639071 /DNA_START=108 /DNA_END=1604 /DNA_ORIENTATION=+
MAKVSVLMSAMFALLCIAVVVVPSGVSAAEEDVLVLTADNFKSTIENEPLLLIKFFAPWCGHCKAMKEDYEKAAAQLKGTAVLADLDATTEEAIAKANNIQGFPTLRVYANGKYLKDYQGGRDEKSIVEYMKKVLEPAYKTISTAAELKAFTEDLSKSRLIAVAPEDLSLWKSASTMTADLVAPSTNMALIESADLIKGVVKADVAANSIVMIPAEETAASDEVVVSKIGDEKELTELIEASAMPTFGLLSMANAKVYVEKKASLVILFLDEQGDVSKSDFVAPFKAVAKEFKKKSTTLKFVYTEGAELKGFKSHMFGEGEVKIPVAVYKFVGDEKYTFDQDSSFTAETFAEWLDLIESGKLAPPRKSAAAPESNDGPVKTVVGNTWEEIVEDPEKDVLVMQMAPWCGHCKKLKPTWEKLGEDLKGDENVVIAMMDATENEAPKAVRAKGFPTIHFYPAGKVQQGIEYKGDRSEEDLISFISKHSKAKHSLSSAKEEL